MPKINFKNGLHLHDTLTAIKLFYKKEANREPVFIHEFSGKLQAGQIYIYCKKKIEAPTEVDYAEENYPTQPITVKNPVTSIT